MCLSTHLLFIDFGQYTEAGSSVFIRQILPPIVILSVVHEQQNQSCSSDYQVINIIICSQQFDQGKKVWVCWWHFAEKYFCPYDDFNIVCPQTFIRIETYVLTLKSYHIILWVYMISYFLGFNNIFCNVEQRFQNNILIRHMECLKQCFSFV